MIKIDKYLILLLFFTFLFCYTGSLTGTITNAETQHPLDGAFIKIQDTDFFTVTDKNGYFTINDIPVGSYNVNISMLGYSHLSKANINIHSNRNTPVYFSLFETSIKGNDIVIKSGFFEKSKDAIVSYQSIDKEEIRSDPIGAYDIQMMIHSLPSVVTNTDQNNEIIVRGGGPGENLFIVDNLEISNPNHFGHVGTGGGPINIINTEFIQRVDFFSGGFPSKYGDKQSSVMEMFLRDGNINSYDLDLEISMAGIGFLFEGPLNKKTSFLSSYRKSFIKDLIKSAGLTSVPEYQNSQHKITFDINNKEKLVFNIIAGQDNINVKDENRPDLFGAENIDYSGYQYTYGLTYKNLFNKNGYYLISAGKNLSSWNAYVYKNTYTSIDTFFFRDNVESDIFLKSDFVYKLSNSLELSSGFNIKQGNYKMDEELDDDTLFIYSYNNIDNYPDINLEETLLYDNYFDLVSSIPEFENILDDYTQLQQYIGITEGFYNKNQGTLWKYSFYNQFKYTFNNVVLTTGLRYDYVPYNETSKFAPRLGLSYIISPISKINIAMGKYYQTPNYWKLMNPDNIDMLKNSYTNQLVIGFEHYIDDDFRLTLEFYNKSIFNRAVLQSDITPDPFDGGLGFVSVGEGKSDGIELFLQKKFSSNWYGTLSYSYSDSKAKDYREDKTGYYQWDFDNKNTFTLVGGYKHEFLNSIWYNSLKESNAFLFLSWIPFFPSDQYEVSFRYKYSEGMPYTPKKYNFYVRQWYIDYNSELNSFRNNYYSRLDVMILRKFTFNKFNLTTFIDLQNVFNRNNEWEKIYFEDGTYEMAYQYKQIPVGGLIIEF